MKVGMTHFIIKFKKKIIYNYIFTFLATFSEILSSVITTDTLKSWVKCNRACYLLVL